jgi:hypothetical protein
MQASFWRRTAMSWRKSYGQLGPALRCVYALLGDSVLPLRDKSGRRIRRDVDEHLEPMAQENYKCFLSLSNALANLDNVEHPETEYNHLQNAANRAGQCWLQPGWYLRLRAKHLRKRRLGV